jgi:hypothetical protein
VVRSDVHRATPHENPASRLILLAVAMTGWGRPVVVKGQTGEAVVRSLAHFITRDVR